MASAARLAGHVKAGAKGVWPRQADRVRKQVLFTLSPEAIARIDECAPRGMRSEFVERLILAYSTESLSVDGVGDSPPFKPAELKEFEARGFVRSNRG